MSGTSFLNKKRYNMNGMRKTITWVASLVVSLGLTLPAQAGFLVGGTTEPSNTDAHGFVDVQVYNLTGGPADPYGIGISAAALQAVGFTSAGTDQFLYLYRTV